MSFLALIIRLYRKKILIDFFENFINWSFICLNCLLLIYLTISFMKIKLKNFKIRNNNKKKKLKN